MGGEIHDNPEHRTFEQETVKNVKIETNLHISDAVKILQSLYKGMEDSGKEADAKDDTEKGIEELTKEYIDDLKKNSECPDTISDASIKPEDLKKRPPEETKELRKEFNTEKERLIAEWEKENGREWPVYENDIYNEYGEIVKRKGWKYDAHHIQPLSLGGKNEASNITPLRYDVHSDHKGVHALDSPYDKLEKMLKEAGTNE